jgi:glycosyltransferase involved in cell wall biosynthesis
MLLEKSKNKSLNTIDKAPLVSVIIPTKNSSNTLQKCLDSIRDQDYKNIEIIVVDNHSNDTTLEIAKRYTNSIYTSSPERSSQINYGVKKCSGVYIYRVDSDFVLETNVVSEAVAESERGGYGAILIHNSSDPTVSFWAKVRKFERDMYDFGSDNLKVAVRFIRRDVFLSIGGFDTRMISGEDYDLHNRIVDKYKIGRINAKETHIGEYKCLRDVARINYFYGKNTILFLKKHKSKGLRQVSPFRRVYLTHYKEFLRHPILSAGFIVYLTIKYASATAGLFAGKI